MEIIFLKDPRRKRIWGGERGEEEGLKRISTTKLVTSFVENSTKRRIRYDKLLFDYDKCA